MFLKLAMDVLPILAIFVLKRSTGSVKFKFSFSRALWFLGKLF
jgi:hypothetical protein